MSYVEYVVPAPSGVGAGDDIIITNVGMNWMAYVLNWLTNLGANELIFHDSHGRTVHFELETKRILRKRS